MATNTYDIKNLWQLYIKNEATPEQVQQLYNLVKAAEQDEEYQTMIEEFIPQIPISPTVDSTSKDFIINNLEHAYPELTGILRASDISNSLTPAVQRVHFLRKWGWVAASILLVVSMGVYFWISTKNNTLPPVVAQQTVDIPPGRDGAILTLANGSQIELDSLGNGVIALQNGSRVVIKNGQLVYDRTGEMDGEMMYNTITTPKGRQFSLLLADGTKVWLNSASSIRYPTLFAGKERKVEVTGEAYFEVTKNSQLPFLVTVNEQTEIQVLGTSFNVNAYENEESINTTLLEGSVKVNGMLIYPGQQAQVTSSPSSHQQSTPPHVRVVNDADTDKVLAWKNGLFDFNGLPFEEIMRQLERWYDIKVVYEKNNIPDKKLIGKMTRGVPLNGLLKNLEKLGIRYKFNDRTLIVLQ